MSEMTSEQFVTAERAAKERVLRVIDAFNALEAGEQRLVAERLASIFSAGMPAAAFEADRLQCEAESWVRLACAGELEAYALAIEDELMRRAAAGRHELRRVFARLWRRLTQEDRAAFLRHVSEGKVA